MKRYKNLWPKVCNIENFKLAYKNAVKGKKHYTDVRNIEAYGVNKYLEELLEEVSQKRYKVSEYKIFHRITGGKDREIFKLPMKDRIVQHAVMNIIEPIFRENFIKDTYSSIKYKGIHAAAKRIKYFLRNYDCCYYLSIDIKKCYPSLDKNILKQKLSKKFKDNDLLWLLFTIVDSCKNGVPIGNYTSQYFNNFYFSEFDHWLKEQKRVKCYIRYCDNITIISKYKYELHALLKEINIKISNLNVSIKNDYQIYDIFVKGVDVVGYIIRKNFVRIRKRIKLNFIRKIGFMNFKNLTPKQINILGSYWGIIKHGDCRALWYKYTNTHSFSELLKK